MELATFNLEGAATAMGRIPSGLFVITSGDKESGTGYLASFVQQVSIEPLIIGICVGKDRAAVGEIRKSKRFAVHVLAKENNSLMKHFARGFEAGQKAFEGIKVSDGILGTPIIDESFAVIECELLPESSQPGDHVIFFGKAVAGALKKSEQPMFHTRPHGRRY
jgi:flavin reductase (DIM6/NTAB) family NADH-FMN oxidoreductase RutF